MCGIQGTSIMKNCSEGGSERGLHRRRKPWIVAGVVCGTILVVAGSVVYFAAARSRNKTEDGEDRTPKAASANNGVVARKESVQEERRALQKVAFDKALRGAEAVRKDLDSLKRDLTECRERLRNPMIQERVMELWKETPIKGPVVRVDQIDSIERSAEVSRDKLDTVTMPLASALAENVVYTPSSAMLDAIADIQSEVAWAKSRCAAYRRLLDNLASAKDASSERKGMQRPDGENGLGNDLRRGEVVDTSAKPKESKVPGKD